MVHPFLTLHIAHRIVPCSIVKCFILPFYILFVTTAYIFQQLCTVTQSCPNSPIRDRMYLTNEKKCNDTIEKYMKMRFDYIEIILMTKITSRWDTDRNLTGAGHLPGTAGRAYLSSSPGLSSASLSMGILSLVSMCCFPPLALLFGGLGIYSV